MFTQPFIQTQIKENIKALCHWPLCGEFTGEFPTQMASNVENVFPFNDVIMGLVQNRQQAITWTNDDQNLLRHVTSLGYNELT